VRLTVLRAGRTDLAVSVAAAPNPVALSAPATWTVTIANLAPTVEVPSFTLTATFNGEVPFRFDAPATPGCTAAPSGNETTISCTLGPLAGGATTTVPLTGNGGFAGDVFANVTVAVNGPVPIDETAANDHATASLSVAQRVAATPAQEIPNLAARAAAAGDLNADGYDDLAIATGSSQGTIVLLTGVDPANPDKRALATTPIALGGEATGNAVAIADLDRDNDLDIVVAAGAGAPNRVFLNNAGTVIASTVANAPQGSRAVAIGDVNGDSFPDLVFAGPQGVTLLLNTGSGGVFGGPASIATGDAQDVLLADLFGDPLPELVIANTAGDAGVYRNPGGQFALEKTIGTGAAAAVRTADFNGDGRYDLVFGRNVAAAGEPVPTNLVWLNTSTASGDFFLSDRLGAAATTSVAVADFDLDGDADVLAVNRDSQQIYANAGAGSGTFALQPEQLQRTAAIMAVTGKFSVDDRVDAAIVANGGVAVFYNDGAGNLGQGDVTGPTIALVGQPSITLTVGDPYMDAGATATDALDGDVTSRIKVTNTVDPAVVGNYAVTYNATDKSGNAATPVVRNVSVQTRAAEGGGGGAADLVSLGALVAAWLARRRLSGRRASRGA
jgi:hypothetical protein